MRLGHFYFLQKSGVFIREMDQKSIWALFILIIVLLPIVNSEVEEVKQALVQFMEKLSVGNAPRDQNWGWNTSSDPCSAKWVGVTCDLRQESVRKIVLDGFNLNGILDASSVCKTKSLVFLSLEENSIAGTVSEEISNCKQLTHFNVGGNKFSGKLPDSLSHLNNLKRLNISNNNFSGELPDLSRISGLSIFFAENNQLSGGIPEFDFSNLLHFNISNNNLSGSIPDVEGRFVADSFSGNPGLCGKPLSNACPPPPPQKESSKLSSTDKILLFSGYILLGLFILLLVALKLVGKKKLKEEKDDVSNKGMALDTSSNKRTSTSSGHRTRSEYSITSADSGVASSSSLVVLTSPMANKLKYEDLLRAPAELLGRGIHGSLYKIVLDDGLMLAVKRLRDWSISSEEFKNRMRKIDHVKHPHVLPPLAYYCSKQEKLLVYEYQPNGSLFNLLHGSHNGHSFDWGSRLEVADCVAKALALMHEELGEDGIAHGNLKSMNILFNKKMEPCISEYGLMVTESQDQSFLSETSSFKMNDMSTFKADVYGFGVILLELLTGKLVKNNGLNLATWVQSVVREERTVEVFESALIAEGVSEERMVNLLQVALQCINPSPNERPSMNQVAVMINIIKDEEGRYISSEE